MIKCAPRFEFQKSTVNLDQSIIWGEKKIYIYMLKTQVSKISLYNTSKCTKYIPS